MKGLRRTAAVIFSTLLLGAALLAQAPATPVTLISQEGRRPIPTILLNNQELVALDDLATLFDVTVREDAAAGGVTVTSRGRTIVVSANASTVSVAGRAVALPSPVLRSGRRWLVPMEFLQLALAPIYDQRIEVRRASRLVIVGDIRVPRVTARVETPGPPTRVIVEAVPPVPMTAAQDGTRVVVRLEADALDVAPAPGGGLVQQIRPGETGNTLVLTLASTPGTVRATPVTTDASSRLTVEVLPAAAAAGPAPDAPEPPRPGRGNDASPPPPEPAALLTARPVLDVVVIDPGHGGDDSGVAVSRDLQEKRLTLDIARRLRTLLESRLGVRVILTRDDDSAVSLDARTAVANNANADLFLSLHANASPAPGVAGAEVFYLRLDREGEQARADAARTAVSLPVIGGATRTIELIPWDLAQARHIEDSAALAGMIADALSERVPVRTPAARQAPVRVLEGLNMPAALVEVAYLTNPAQRRRAASDEFKTAVAEALHAAVVRFRQYLEEAGPR